MYEKSNAMTLHLTAPQPIGIFDSGIGGLTVASAIVRQLPHENIIYFGDTAHLPYGDKSQAAIQAYSVKIAHMLLQQNCKLILIACNSASTAAYELVREYIAEKALVMDVIEPVIHFMRDGYAQKHIGLIGTKQTVTSNVYQKKIDALNAEIKLTSLATNLLASAIEEFGNHDVIDGLLQEYLSHQKFIGMDALILACTHYPIIKEKIIQYYNNKIDIIDPSDVIAASVKKRLHDAGLLNSLGKNGTKRFYVSDYTESFAAGTKLFFNEEVLLEHYPLWE
jgi:glutamate racemase